MKEQQDKDWPKKERDNFLSTVIIFLILVFGLLFGGLGFCAAVNAVFPNAFT